jgi:hypothetical protein
LPEELKRLDEEMLETVKKIVLMLDLAESGENSPSIAARLREQEGELKDLQDQRKQM